jgi:serine/threonine-protein kinase
LNAADPLIGKTLADRFEILERIGEGGTGVVYKAKQLSVDRIIAIKVLGAHVSTDPSWVKRFHNEARAASRLDHPNTVRLIDFGQTKEGLLFIAMEYLHGKSLRQEIDRVGRLPPNRVLRIMSQMCASLSEAHNQGIIHRDIKPDNVYLVDMKGAGDYVKVLDFSVAKLDAPDAQVTRAGVVFGTPQYMSPEQGRGIPLDARSDIYAVGIVAYEMLTGKPPFDAKVPTEVVMMHLRDRPAPLQGLPPPLVTIVMRALEKDAAMRQQSAEALDTECQQCLADLFPRQTPGAGLSPPMQQQAAPEQRTMMAMEAPRPGQAMPGKAPADQRTSMPDPALARTAMPGSLAPPPPANYAPPPASYVPQPSYGAPKGAASEQKTMMAMEAPRIGGGGAPPPAEQKTMMAMEAPRPGPSPDIRTAQAGEVVSARLGLQPPPPAPPPPMQMSNPNMMAPAGGGNANMKTMMATEAPNLQNQRTMMGQQAPASQGIVEGGTKILPDSAGVVAYATERAQQARYSNQPVGLKAPPAGPLFWMAWIILGIGVGLGLHFYLMAKGG